MKSDLRNAIEYVASAMANETGGWWIIGSAAMSLASIDVMPDDVDVMASETAVALALSRAGLQPFPPSPHALFRSAVFASHQVPGALRVEFMGGFEIHAPAGWQKLEVRTRRKIETEAGPVYIPELTEQIEILHRFGRDKDVQRAQLIREFLDRETL